MMKSPPGRGASEELRAVVEFVHETSQGQDASLSSGFVVCWSVQKSTDLSLWGRSISSLLDRIHASLTTTEVDEAETLSTSLLRLANEKLNSFDYRSVPLCWRRLYTDSTLLKSLARLLRLETSEEILLDVVRDLDMALIVAGAPGQNRSELVFQLISIAQSRLPEEEHERPLKRQRLERTTRETIEPPYLARPLPVLPSLPDFLLPSIDPSHTRPFVVRSAASDWVAREKWKDVNYLRSIGGGKGRVVPVEVGHDYTKPEWGQRIIPWFDFLSSTFNQEEEEEYYLAQYSLLNQFPLLERDFLIPSLVYSEPPALEDQYKEYEKPKNEEGWIMNAWLGRGGTVSQAHTDPYWNCYIQVVGRKWVWIAPPSVSPHMSTFGRQPRDDNDDAGQDEESKGTTTEYMTNTSTIDVTQPLPSSPPSTSSSSDIQDSNYTLQYLERVESVAQQIVLEAGDILVMPPGWWHAMKSLETSFSISIWF
ncbi:uncharacterized protein JCM6883_000738 [Sporobolomyces salmoneus]|uniref:uncharacterized protein n=1 Tax=Sporobolomyces salmoneus TaxID=183962 RepID=UPI00316C1DD4